MLQSNGTGIRTDGSLTLRQISSDIQLSGRNTASQTGISFGKDSALIGTDLSIIAGNDLKQCSGLSASASSVLSADPDCTITVHTPNGSAASSQTVIKTDLYAYAEDAAGKRNVFNPSGKDLSGYIKLTVPYEKKTYTLAEGMDQTWTAGSENPLSFTFRSSFFDEDTLSHFSAAQLDASPLREDLIKKETDSSGKGLILTLPATVLRTLKTGDHTLQTEFDDSDTPLKVTFTVTELPIARIPVYRLYNPFSGEHLYTGSQKELTALADLGWKKEGIAFHVKRQGEVTVYRLYNPVSGDHLFTGNVQEKESLLQNGWNDEGIAWRCDKGSGIAVYRLYNPNAENGTHLLTCRSDERDSLVSLGWIYEGIAFFTLQ